MEKMFEKGASKEVLILRNIIITTVEWSLGLITLMIDLMVLARYVFEASNPPNPEYRILAVVLTLLSIRFFYWSYWYHYDQKDNREGDSLTTFRKTKEPNQTKLFTFKLHKDGDTNPLK